MKTKKIGLFIIAVTLFGLFNFSIHPVPALADDTGTEVDDVDSEESSFSNAAQAQHAENLAEASASEAQKEVDAVKSDLDAAQAKADGVSADPNATNEEIAEANEELEEAQKAYEYADEVHSEAVANSAATSSETIAEMRESGKGWGQIAHELGIHRGVLGLGHNAKVTREEKFTKRDPKSDLSEGYATIGGQSSGLSRAEYKKGVGRGVDGKGGSNTVGISRGNSGHSDNNSGGKSDNNSGGNSGKSSKSDGKGKK